MTDLHITPSVTGDPGASILDATPLAFSSATAERWVWSAEEIRRVGYQVVDLIAAHLTSLPDQPAFQPVPPELAEAFRQTPLPREGQSPDAILHEFSATVEPYPFGNGHPRFYGWVNSPPAIMGIFAEALAAAMDPSVAGGNHAAVHVEHQVLRWFIDLIGLPSGSAGLLVSGTSMATLTALAVARHVKAGWDVRASGLQSAHPRLIVYTSVEGHGCVRKAVEMLGMGSDNLRLIPVDARRRMGVSDLEDAIAGDIAAGHHPIAVVASAGTTSTGAIDPLAAIADTCRRHDLWLHIDGAYGAPALLTRRYRDALTPLSLADSLSLDPHKWMYVPVEAGLILVRDGQAMRDTFSLVPPYLRTDGDPAGVGGLPWFSEYGFQQTRGFRALKVWMALKHHGIAGYAEAIERDCALAEYLATRVAASSEFELVATGLSVVCFRYTALAPTATDAQVDVLNERLLHDIQLGGQAFLTSTVLDHRFVLRACIINPRASQADMDLLLDVVRSAGRRLAEAGVAGPQ